MQRLRKQKPLERAAGILLPISSLPSPYGIGTLGSSAYAFIDFLHGAGQRYWQVLPVGPTSYGDSPYQSFSAFAGNPYFIDLDMLVEEGILDKKTIESEDWGDDPERIDYAKLYKARFRVLRQAFDRWQPKGSDYEAFVAKNAHWLEDYCLYMAIKLEQGGKSWLEWPDELRMGDNLALDRWRGQHETDIEFWKFCQYQFMAQWKALQAYAHQRHVQIIGDIPIYVALDSADVWRKSGIFSAGREEAPHRLWPVFRQTFSPPRVSFGEIPCITGKPCVKRNTPGGKPECSTVHRSLTSSASTTLSESFGTTRSPTGRRLPWWENTAKDQGKNCFKP